VIENFYTLQEIEESEDKLALLDEIKTQLVEEILDKIGPVSKCELFEQNPFCKLKFNSVSDAQKCIELMHGRWFD
jgi:hypothetical protein